MHLSQGLLPGVRMAYGGRVKPAYIQEHGSAPPDRHAVRRAMQRDLHYQLWSALRRNSMEARQQAGRSVVFRQLGALRAKADALNEGAPTLLLDASIEQPRYMRAVDTHCMPGSHHSELVDRDIAAGAIYDASLFVTTADRLGRYFDGGGQTVVGHLSPQPLHQGLGCGGGESVAPGRSEGLAQHLHVQRVDLVGPTEAGLEQESAVDVGRER